MVADDLSVDRLLYFYSEDNAHQPDVIAFWESKLQLDCVVRRSLLLSVDECLLHRFVVKDIYPSSLRPAMELLLNRPNSLLTRDQLLDGSIVDNESSEFIVKSKLTWQLVQATYFSIGRQQLHSNAEYAPVQLLRRCCDCIQQYLSTVSDSQGVVFRTPSSSVAAQFTFGGLLRKVAGYMMAASGAPAHMAELFESIAADSSQSALLMAYLIGKRHAVLSSDGSIVKIAADRRTSNDDPPSLLSIWWFKSNIHERVGKLSEVDESSLRISCSIDCLLRARDRVDVAIENHLVQARSSKMRNDKAAALVHLSMKRSNEKLRSQLSVSLMQLEEARLALERCDINGLIVNTYREAARGLKAARMGGDLTVETAEEAMDLLQEEMDELNSIGEIIGGSRGGDLTDEQRAELELELQSLMDEMPADNRACSEEGDSLVDALSRVDLNATPMAPATPQREPSSEPKQQPVPI